MNAFGVDDPRVSKADRSSGDPSAGRRVTHWAGGGFHTLAVSPKGRKGKNLGSDLASGAAGAAPGAALYGVGVRRQLKAFNNLEHSRAGVGATMAGGLLAGVGGLAARQANLTRMNRKGYLKPDEGKVSKGVTTGLKMVGGNVSRSSVAGGTKKTSDLMRRMAAGRKAGKALPHGNFSQTQLGRMKEDPFE